MDIKSVAKTALCRSIIYKAWLGLFVLALSSYELRAQCASVDFALPSTACLEQDLRVAPAITYDNYEWDFCSGDFENAPSASVFVANASSAFNIELVSENGSYYGFYFSRGFQRLYRLDFGSNPNSTPVVVDLGDLGVGSNAW